MTDHAASARAIAAIIAAAALIVASPGCGPASAYAPPGFTLEEWAWEEHHAAERAGDLEAAVAGYRALCEAEPGYARACYDRVRVLFEMGRTGEARAETMELVVAHPSHALSPTAVARLAASYEEGADPGAGIAALEGLEERVRGTDVWDSTVYELARLHRGRGDGAGEAGALARIVAEGRWGSQLWDDAIWRSVELASSRGERDKERRLLEKIVASQEESRLIGSYNSKYHDDALLRLGRLLLEDGRLEEAHGAFERLMAWKTSRLRDDGTYWAAVVRLRQGRAADACALLHEISSKMVWSNSVDDAAELAREAGCGRGAAGR